MNQSQDSFQLHSDKQLPEIPKKEQNFRRTIHRISINLWLWELLGLLTSTSCITAILVILGVYNGKPVPSWSYGLTINGVVSILAVISKAALVLPIAEAISQLKWCWYWDRQRPVMDFERFDSASRGPWGSLMLLCHPRIWHLGTVGAALTLAAIAVEPSLQQIPTYPLITVANGNASIPLSTYYKDVDSTPLGPSVSSGLKGATYSGIFDSSASIYADITPNCPTGNCTWSEYTSLGVCSVCRNSTESLQIADDGTAWTIPGGWDFRQAGVGENISSDYVPLMHSSGVKTGLGLAFNQIQNQSLADVYYQYRTPISNVSLSSRHPQVFQCVIYLCLKTYTAKVVQGHFEETIVDTWPSPDEGAPGVPDVSNFMECVMDSWTYIKKCNASSPGNFTLQKTHEDPAFSMAMTPYKLLKLWIRNVMEMDWKGYSDAMTSPWDEAYHTDVQQAFWTAQAANLSTTNISLADALKMPGPGDVLDSMTTRMTNHMRSVSHSDEAAVGIAYSLQNVVRARWAWAAFPLVLLVVTFGFLTLTVVVTLRKGVPIWKSSSLASLLHGLEDESCNAMTAQRFDHLESKAKEFAMSLKLEDSRWRLRGGGR